VSQKKNTQRPTQIPNIPSPLPPPLLLSQVPTRHGGGPPPSAAAASGSGGGGEKGALCQECGEQPWNYRCPGCSRLTCSLPCVQAHKRRTACSGKRPRTVPVALAQFDGNQLLSDYNLLEETSQVRESAHRLLDGFGCGFEGRHGAQLLPWLSFLGKAAERRGVRLAVQT
uniref:Box C/D snoRNA protein 1 n=9 Tax=Aegilops tauschii subsp. strangulata TaxID=200361 RepID=A0A453B063_AEGTS